MTAALHAADETVVALLACTMRLLAPVTYTGLGEALVKLAREQVPVTPDIRELVERAAKDQEAGRKGLEAAVKYGRADIVELLIEKMVEQPLPESLTERLLEQAVMSDSSLHLLRHGLADGQDGGTGLCRSK